MSVKHSNISIFVPHLGCPNMCSFCNQHYIARTEKVPTEQDIINAVEIAKSSKNYNPSTTEIAFFGGSFTAIERDMMISLLEWANPFVADGTVCGIRISTRPDAIDEEVLDILARYGVKTIELGAQSMCDRVLTLNDRGHSAEDVINASILIKQKGFLLGLQMMTGLYGSSAADDIKTAEQIIKLSPDCVRIYPTIVLKNTRLADLVGKGEYEPQTVDEAVRLCTRLKSMFDEACVPVIRLGLHTIDETAYIAGPWHPAFRELCDAEEFKNKISRGLKEKGCYEVFVNPRDLSKAKGQSKSNIDYFSKIGYNIKIIANDDIKINDVLIKGCE
ncbi:MAG: radical SAM protein [Clostridia bacterium]|nr:radical SAM protein [Clostridia bacterium]